MKNLKINFWVIIIFLSFIFGGTSHSSAQENISGKKSNNINGKLEYNHETLMLYKSCKEISSGNENEGVLCKLVLDAALNGFATGMLYTLGMLDHDVEKRTEKHWQNIMEREKSCSGGEFSRSEWNMQNQDVIKYVAVKYIEIMDSHPSFFRRRPIEGIQSLLVHTDCKD